MVVVHCFVLVTESSALTNTVTCVGSVSMNYLLLCLFLYEVWFEYHHCRPYEALLYTSLISDLKEINPLCSFRDRA